MRKFLSPSFEESRYDFGTVSYEAVPVKKQVFSSLLGTSFNDSDGRKHSFYESDISLLFNQERLDTLGKDTVDKIMKEFAPSFDRLSELREQISDDDFLKLVKSRHIQSPCELMAWNDLLTDLEDYEVNRLKSKKTLKSDDKSVEPDKTD